MGKYSQTFVSTSGSMNLRPSFLMMSFVLDLSASMDTLLRDILPGDGRLCCCLGELSACSCFLRDTEVGLKDLQKTWVALNSYKSASLLFEPHNRAILLCCRNIAAM